MIQNALQITHKSLRSAIVQRGDETALNQPCCIVVSLSDGKRRAISRHWSGACFDDVWLALTTQIERIVQGLLVDGLHLRFDYLVDIQTTTWANLKKILNKTKRNYFTQGIALGENFDFVFLNQELNGNAVLYGSNEVEFAQLHRDHFNRYAREKYGSAFTLNDADEATVQLFNTIGFYLPPGHDKPLPLHVDGIRAGSRYTPDLTPDACEQFIASGSNFLARQVDESGRFVYGLFPCFDREVPSYNALRHASTTYAMIEAWEVNLSEALKAAIDRALHHLTNELIKLVSLPGAVAGQQAAFLVDTGNEIKLGGNAVCILALCKYTEVTGDRRYLTLLKKLAHGIAAMFNPETGQFVHVLNYPSLEVKEAFRIIYYDGEAAFALMRLYRIARFPVYLQIVEKAFEYFIRAGHDDIHDHWLSYCVNELTIYRPDRKYFEFGIRNFSGHLDFVLNRITTFPTLLELMMAAEQMLQRMQSDPDLHDLLATVDIDRFYRAMHHRANYLLSGYFWPEWAMFFKNPARIAGSFFIRHHAFRVRIDDVEHYLSGLVAYRKFLLERKPVQANKKPVATGPILAWGGDVNLGRRMLDSALSPECGDFIKTSAFKRADFAIVNLECVVALSGQQGVDKGEGGPYYFRATPNMLNILKRSNIQAVITANNHCGDYGTSSLLEQSYWLDQAGLMFAGTGRNSSEASLPLDVRVGDVRVALFGLDSTQSSFAATGKSPGSNYINLSDLSAHETMLKCTFDQAKGWADLVIVAIHWGPNREIRPIQLVREAARKLIDLGVHAILGSSSHVLQGVEIYKGRPIVYDAGDLLFDSRDDANGKPGAVFNLRLSSDGITAIEVIPLSVGYRQTSELTGQAGITQLQHFAALCREMGTHVVVGDNAIGTILVTPQDRFSVVGGVRHSPGDNQFENSRLPVEAPDVSLIRRNWMPSSVPHHARIDPVRLGPLVLKGINITPRHLTSRAMIWVETFWELYEPTQQNLLIDIKAVPMSLASLSVFGSGCEHQPCDWLEPSNTWVMGQVYRDYYGLRPPPMSQLKSGIYKISIRVLEASKAISGVSFLESIVVELQQNTRQIRITPLTRRESGGVWTAEEIQNVTGGRWLVPPNHENWFVNGVVRSQSHSKLVGKPCLFVASSRENLAFHEMNTASSDKVVKVWDTHSALPTIQDRFAAAIVKDVPVGLRADFPVLKVDDPIRSLMELGASARHRLEGLVVAVTGSAGKSSVVAMTAKVAAPFLKVASSYDNYNSRVGMLTCLASVAANVQLVALEVAVSAINAPGFIPIKAVRPDVAIITNIAASHLKPGQTLSDIARRKGNLMEAVRHGGRVILNRDDPFFAYFADRASKLGLDIITVGKDQLSHVRVVNYSPEDSSTRISVYGRELQLKMAAAGEHMALNACFVLAILSVQGILSRLADEQLQQVFAEFKAPEGRGNRLDIVLDDRRISVINEAYNANPSSMKAALQTFAQIPSSANHKVLVLGDMLELGDLEADSHMALVDILTITPVRSILFIGKAMLQVHTALKKCGTNSLWFETSRALSVHLIQNLQDTDLVMMKASNGIGLYGVIESLRTNGLRSTDG